MKLIKKRLPKTSFAIYLEKWIEDNSPNSINLEIVLNDYIRTYKLAELPTSVRDENIGIRKLKCSILRESRRSTNEEFYLELIDELLGKSRELLALLEDKADTEFRANQRRSMRVKSENPQVNSLMEKMDLISDGLRKGLFSKEEADSLINNIEKEINTLTESVE